MAITLNAQFFFEQQKYAEGYQIPPAVGGMMHVVQVTLLTHMQIYRFASRKHRLLPDRLYGAHWWFGVSAHDALIALAKAEGRGLRTVARECLAVPPEWGNTMDLLVPARVGQSLSAWSGTPRTARSKNVTSGFYGAAWKPDRSITQLYVPGLRKRRPDLTDGPFVKWSDVLEPSVIEDVE